MKWLDLPPVWLLAAIAAAWAIDHAAPVAALGAWSPAAGWILIVAGLGLTGSAALELRRHRTTIVPHREPAAMVTTGIYRRSRNPIYLADVLILTGVVLILGSGLPLLLVPLLAWVLRVRFILPEEARLAAAYGPAFERWCETTRRWI